MCPRALFHSRFNLPTLLFFFFLQVMQLCHIIYADKPAYYNITIVQLTLPLITAVLQPVMGGKSPPPFSIENILICGTGAEILIHVLQTHQVI